MTLLLFLAILDGLAYAAQVFMVAVGLTLIFGVLRILNVAHGSFFAIGGYVAATIGAWAAATVHIARTDANSATSPSVNSVRAPKIGARTVTRAGFSPTAHH